MNQAEYIEFHKEFCAKALATSTAKNNDYARPQDQVDDPFAPFANFRKAELMNVCSTEQGFIVRLLDKVCRVSNLLKPGHVRAVLDEKIEDTLQDAVNYLILLAAYLKTKREVDAQRSTFAARDLERVTLSELLSRACAPVPGTPPPSDEGEAAAISRTAKVAAELMEARAPQTFTEEVK